MKFALLTLSLLMIAGSAQAALTDSDGKRSLGASGAALVDQAATPTPGMPPRARRHSTVERGLILAEQQQQEAQRHAPVPRSLY